MKKFNLLTDEIINEMEYDCSYDIRKMEKNVSKIVFSNDMARWFHY